MRRFSGSPLPKGGDRMERKYTVFLVEGDWLTKIYGIVHLNGIDADMVDYLFSLIGAGNAHITMVIQAE